MKHGTGWPHELHHTAVPHAIPHTHTHTHTHTATHCHTLPHTATTSHAHYHRDVVACVPSASSTLACPSSCSYLAASANASPSLDMAAMRGEPTNWTPCSHTSLALLVARGHGVPPLRACEGPPAVRSLVSTSARTWFCIVGSRIIGSVCIALCSTRCAARERQAHLSCCVGVGGGEEVAGTSTSTDKRIHADLHCSGCRFSCCVAHA